MASHHLYAYILIGSFIVPFIASFYPKYPFYKEWKYILPSIFIVAIPFLIWDSLFTSWKVWGFNDKYITGIKFFQLPIEEILFFFIIPYCSLFVFYVIPILLPRLQKIHVGKSIIIISLIASISLTILYFPRLYTSVTFGFLSIYFIIALYLSLDITKHFSYYIFVLPFFLIVNGILTGTGIQEPVVWYNPNHHIGLRIGTIPFEDAFYGFLMISASKSISDFLKDTIIMRHKSLF